MRIGIHIYCYVVLKTYSVLGKNDFYKVKRLALMRVELIQGIWYAFFGNLPWIIVGIILLAVAMPLLINLFTNPLVSTLYQTLAYLVPFLIVFLIIALIIRLVSRPRAATYY